MMETANEGMEPAAENRSTLIERLAGKLGGSARAQTIYGESVVRDGVTIIPVAKVAYGFGGGIGRGEQGSGEGGGGGVSATPVGYIEIRNGETSFHRIFDPLTLAPLIMAGGAACTMVLRGLYRIMKRDGHAPRAGE
jgi:hypothetical protein